MLLKALFYTEKGIFLQKAKNVAESHNISDSGNTGNRGQTIFKRRVKAVSY